MTRCHQNFPSLYFLLEDAWLEVSPSHYVVNLSQGGDSSDICVLLLKAHDAAFIVMGIPLYMDYYTTHDETNNRIGFVPHTSSNLSSIKVISP